MITCVTRRISRMIHFEATERNKQPILDVLERYIPKTEKGFALEIASGTGQHVVHFAEKFQNFTWQPSDIDDSYLNSISTYIAQTGLKNIHQPLKIDVSTSAEKWTCGIAGASLESGSCDLMNCINLIHISPWYCTVGLFRSAGYLLKSNGVLVTYGPYSNQGKITPESNVAFDNYLKSRDPEWGLRDIEEIKKIASDNRLNLEEIIEMPTNNKTLIFRKI